MSPEDTSLTQYNKRQSCPHYVLCQRFCVSKNDDGGGWESAGGGGGGGALKWDDR